MRAWLARFWSALALWWANPAPTPEEIGKTKQPTSHQPIPIELGFFLHADGKVYQRDRERRGDIRIHDTSVIALVHREYKILAGLARKRIRAQKIRAALTLRSRVLDTTKSGG